MLAGLVPFCIYKTAVKEETYGKPGYKGKHGIYCREIMDAVLASGSLEDGINAIQEILESNGIVEIITD